MRIISALVMLLAVVSSSDKLLNIFGRRSLSSGKCLVDNPSNAGRPLCYIDGKQVDTCSNTGCGGCCGSQCSWVGTYCNEADGVVAKCPGGYSQVGTLSKNNDIGGAGLGQSQQNSIADCKNLCDKDPMCVAFMYGGANTKEASTLCELSGTVTPNNDWGTNFRFCRKTVACLQENPDNAARPLCFLNEVFQDTCSNKGCNGCCGSTCSWIGSYCSDRIVAECPSGYKQIGTLSVNNDIKGPGLSQTQEDSIEDCQALCESTEGCVAFMYGGASTVHDSKKCELSSSATPNNGWGSNFRFCQMLTEEPTGAPTVIPSQAPTVEPTSAPTYLSTSEYALVTDATSCEAVGMDTITTTAQCAAAVSALDLAEIYASDVQVSDYHDRKDGCIWHARFSGATVFSGSARPDQPCNYRGYAGCVCSRKFALVTDAISCEAVGMKTITTTTQCAAAISTLKLAESLDATDITVSDYHDRKDGCIWHAGATEATLFTGSTRPDQPCNYRGYAGCVCANPKTVTCRMTIDNRLTQLRYNGQSVATTSGDWKMWTVPKVFSFVSIEGAALEIGGYEEADCHGCKCSGLLVECDNGFVSTTSDWLAIGESSEVVQDESFGSVCKSTSSFFLKGQTSNAEKIWPSGGQKYAYFRAIPSPDEFKAFVKGPKTGCEPGYMQPTSAEDCKEIAAANSVRYWGGAGHSSSADPRGCIYRTPDNDVYFNTHKTGSTNRDDRRTVCVQAFVKGPKEGCESGYVQPQTAEECKALAEASNIRYWGGAGHSSGADPRGCIYRTPDKDIYFNTHKTGSTNRGDRKTVCVPRN